MLLSYEEMSERSFGFYDDLQITMTDKNKTNLGLATVFLLAVRSLTMPQYAIMEHRIT